jgi:DMSO reductase anchor subunit
MESGLTMLVHSVIIGIVLYFIMTMVFKQRTIVAQNRSLVLAAVALIYMIAFGHGLPGKVNTDLL